MLRWMMVLVLLMFAAAPLATGGQEARAARDDPQDPFIVVLGVAQDAGYPQAACRRDCCVAARANPELARMVVCLGLVDPATKQRWMFECTPDMSDQLAALDTIAPPDKDNISQAGLDGVFITHAHIGHYTGLIHLGREVMGASGVPVYAMDKMRAFLRDNGPWSQLVELNNIELRPLADDTPVQLNDRLSVTPLRVPHRDEYSETVGYRITGPNKSVLFIPDIDKWERWERRIEDEIAKVDIAYLDGSFYRNGEIFGRDMSLIPHPFIEESMQRFDALPADERAKVRFIHLNHTNPALHESSEASREIGRRGFHVARQGERFSM